MDAPWDKEHGDKINRLDFTKDVLSNVIPTNEHEDEAIDNAPFTHSMELEQLLDPARMNQLDPNQVKCTPHIKQVPRALLLRCWQRAMDAASFSTLQTSSRAPPKFGSLKDTTRLQQLQKPASQRCIDLTVDMFPWATPTNPPYTCRLCETDFDTKDKLKEHFHGTDTVRGCAWSEIHAKQRQLLADSLEREVASQAGALVQFVMTRARDRLNANKNTNNQSSANAKTAEESSSKANPPNLPNLLNWKDVLSIMKEALLSSVEYEDDEEETVAEGDMPPLRPGKSATSKRQTREVTKTLQVREDLPPLVFNHQVLEAVSYRLIDRYAPVPL